MPRPPVLGYLQSAVADNTAHSQMDKLIFEDEMSNIQPEWGTMREEQEGYDPAKVISEGDFMPVGAGVKLFRGVPKWFKKQMVQGGKHVSPGPFVESVKKSPKGGFQIIQEMKPEGVWASKSKQYAEDFAKGIQYGGGGKGTGVVLEFDVPQEWWEKASKPFRKYYTRNIKGKSTAPDDFYLGGIPKEYLKKVHKGYQQGGPAENDDSSKYDYNRELPHKMPWYTKSILAMMGNELQTPVDWDEEGNVSKVSRHSWSPKGVEQAYNIATDELGFSPDMVNRKNIFLKMLPRETMHYLKTGDITPELIDVRTHLLDMYFDRDSKSQQKLIDSLLEYDKIIDIYTDKGEQFIPKIAHSGLLNPDNLVELFEEKYRDKWYKKPEGKQQGGSAERKSPLAYMNPAIQDETAHSQMDRLMFENELEQQPHHSMRTYQQGYDPAREWGEGMMPIGGAMKLLKGSKEWPDLVKAMAQSSLRDKRKMEVINNARNIFGKKIDAGGADEATRQYLESKWMEKVIQ